MSHDKKSSVPLEADSGVELPDSRRMIRVGHVAPVFTPLPASGYGGVERIIVELTAIQRQLNEVEPVTYASSDSSLPGVTRAIESSPASRALDVHEAHAAQERHMRFVLESCGDLDLLHVHGNWFLPYVEAAPVPVVTSVYADTSQPAIREELRRPARNNHLIANSDRTRSNAPGCPWFGTVLEGLDLERYPFRPESEGYFVFVGALVPWKGCHIAIRAARALGRQLYVVGPREPLHLPPDERELARQYVEQDVNPLLGPGVEYLGELGEDRLDVISNAAALISPITWEEPFGRVLAESLACGTPVVAYRRGAAPEVVTDSVTGYVVDNFEELLGALEKVATLDRATCRASAVRKFDMRRVASEYSNIYSRVLKES